MNLADLATKLLALGVSLSDEAGAVLADLGIRQVLRDATPLTREVPLSIPSGAVEVEHEFGSTLTQVRPSRPLLGAELSHDDARVRVHPAPIEATTVTCRIVEPPFPADLAQVPADFEDAVLYATALAVLDAEATGEVIEAGSGVLKVKRAPQRSARRERFETRYREALP
jgi:hypothetical protein